MYFQNFLGMMAPQPLGDGKKGWAVPMNPAAKCLHVGDPTELGQLVARAFGQPDTVGQGQYLSQASETTSWQEMVDTLNSLGHTLVVNQVPNEVFDSFPIPGAQELREMMNYFEEYTYFGPDANKKACTGQEAMPRRLHVFCQMGIK